MQMIFVNVLIIIAVYPLLLSFMLIQGVTWLYHQLLLHAQRHLITVLLTFVAMPWLVVYGDAWDDPPPYVPRRFRRTKWKASTVREAMGA